MQEAAIPTAAASRKWWPPDRRVLAFAGFCAVLSLLFLVPLAALWKLAMKEELHSHILLIPVISIYLAATQREALPAAQKPWFAGAVAFCALAAVTFFLPNLLGTAAGWSGIDLLARTILSYVLLLAAGGCAILGGQWMRRLAFPFAFLIFMIPLPDAFVVGLEEFLMWLSADLSEFLFRLTGTPVFRRGQVLELPGVTLEVARECSGIRSTIVLFITSLLASYMFLKSTTHRILLVAMVIPLGILRNAIRVVTIGLLCMHVGPEMIDSWIHHRGGPVFFAISLVPLFAVAAWFRYRENRYTRSANAPADALAET